MTSPLQLASVCLLGLAAVACAAKQPATSRPATAPSPSPAKSTVYLGTYTSGTSPARGIYRGTLDYATGTLGGVVLAAEAKDPAYLAVHPGGRHLYAVSERSDREGRPEGGVLAFSIDPTTSALTLLNEVSSGGAAPCHLMVDAAGKTVVVANYGGGSVASFPLGAAGALVERAGFVQHEGSGPNLRRQQKPHAHAAVADPAGRRVYVADLGTDEVRIYRVDANGALVPNGPAAAKLPPGSGPRHVAFHPGGKFAYVNGELDATITAFSHDAGTGTLTVLHTLSTLPEGHDRKSTAHLAVTPDGRHVYVSNRGHDSLAIYAIDQQSGRLTLLGHQSSLGKTPRDFGIDPTGTFLLAANQDSNTVVVFRIDRATGQLTPIGHPVPVPRPVSVVFLPRG